ncbi:MAG: hypothetical protein FWE90_13380 [Defluviitaleaceae bacterium]|jgi:hypothetical protein|nr:hypothetical protein [Defluviitaleaceae bacterium]
MEKQAEKIMRFSKVIYVLLKIAFIVLIVAGSLQALSLLLSLLNLNTEIVTIAGVEMEAPLLFKLGETKLYLPMAWESNFDIMGTRSLFEIGFEDLMLTVFTIIGLGFGKSVFSLLRENGSPFRDDVVKSLKKLAIALLCMGVVAGLTSFFAAGIVWVLCLIFDYGRSLQNERDTTL